MKTLKFHILQCFCCLAWFLPGQVPADTVEAQKWLKQSQARFDSADYLAAIRLGEQALTLYACLLGTEAQQVGQACLLMGKAYFEQGNLPEASRFFDRAQLVFARQSPFDSLQLAEVLNARGKYEAAIGNFPKSMSIHRQALGIRKRQRGSQHPEVANSYNNIGNLLFRNGHYADALEYQQTALNIRLNSLGPNHLETASSYNNLGACLASLADYAAALSMHEQALAIRQSQLGEAHLKTAQSLNNIGNCLFHLGKVNEALKAHQQALAIRQSKLPPGHTDIAQSLLNIGNCFRKTNRPEDALNNYQKATLIWEKEFGTTHLQTASAYDNLAECYFNKGDISQARNYFEKALAIKNTLAARGQLQANHPQTAHSLAGLARCQRLLNSFGLATENFNRALRIYETAYGKNNINSASCLNNLGNCFFAQNDYSSALVHFEQCRQILETLNGGHGLATVYANTGNCLYELGKYFEAKAEYQKAYEQLKTDSLNKLPLLANILANLGSMSAEQGEPKLALQYFSRAQHLFLDTLSNIHSGLPIEMLAILEGRGELLLGKYHREGRAECLYESYEALRAAANFMDTLLINYRGRESKLFLKGKHYQIFSHLINCCVLLHQLSGQQHYLHQAFAFSEKTNGMLIREAINRMQAQQFAGLPDNLLAREAELKAALGLCRRQLAEEKGRQKANELTLRMLDVEQKYNALLAHFESHFPTYYQLRYDLSTVTVPEIRQNYISKGEGLLKYFMADTALYAFLITADTFQLTTIPLWKPLSEQVGKLRSSISGIATASTESQYRFYTDTYRQTAYSLYQQIFLPLEERYALPQKLTIIAGGALGYLPFEVLLSQRPEKGDLYNFRGYSYLVRDYQFSYNYSATLLKEMQDKNPNLTGKPFAGFSPVFLREESALEPLRHNEEEISQLNKLVRGDHFTGSLATLQTFLEKASDYRILHLATHGVANDEAEELSFLAFSELPSSSVESRLYVRDMYNLQLNADLVVLSACETGIGKYLLGEGIVSLASGFSYAGAKSIITSLWKADDQKTAGLMQAFYQNLRSGMPKDEALHKAKLAYLQTADNEMSQPFFWAAFIPLGDMAPLEWKKPLSKTPLAIGLLALLALAWLARQWRLFS